MKKFSLTFTLLIVIYNIQCIAACNLATFTYQYHNEAIRSGAFKFECSDDASLNIDKAASAGYLGAANNPYMQATKNWGPIPSGDWEIYAIKNEKLAILRLRSTVLIPNAPADFKRDGFLIHGFSQNGTPESSSHGCIIIEKVERDKLMKAFKKYGIIKLKVNHITTGNMLSFFNKITEFESKNAFFVENSLNLQPQVSNPAKFTIIIQRLPKNADCGFGLLSINNSSTICSTMELPALSNAPNVSSIPAGKYKAHLKVYGGFNTWFKGFRIELENVPGRSNIQIHAGTKLSSGDIIESSKLSGCVLIGTKPELINGG
jgi:hypothetical protein